MSSRSIQDDKTALEGVKEMSRGKYLKAWSNFKAFSELSSEFDEWMPTEKEFSSHGQLRSHKADTVS